MSLAQTEMDMFPSILSGWTATDVEFPNVKYDQRGVPYLRVNIAESSSTSPCIAGSTKFERGSGEIVGSLFMPRNMTSYGGKTATTLAEQFKNLITQQRFGQTITFTGRVVDAGLSSDEAWYRYNILVRYQTNTVKS